MTARPIRFTRLGTFYILFTVGVGAAAINTGNNLLYLILGILLGFIVVSGLLSDSGLWGVGTQWRPLENLYAGRPASFACEVRKGWFPAVGITLTAAWSGAHKVQHLLHWIGAHRSVEHSFSVTPTRRGWLELRQVGYKTRFPFGFFEKFHVESRSERWLVYPKVELLNLHDAVADSLRAAHRPAARAGSGAAPFLFRDFREGDAANRIHWKLSAKRQELIVNEMEEEADNGDTLFVARWPTTLTYEKGERLISFVASLAYTLHQAGRPVGLMAPGATFPSETSRAQIDLILKYLALVNLKNSKEDTARVIETGHTVDVIALWSGLHG